MAHGSTLRAAILATSLLAACGGSFTVDGVTILRYDGPVTGSPTALAIGTIRFLDGCVALENPDPLGAPASQTILWPPGTMLQRVDDRLGVAVGSVIAFDGDHVQLGGGEQKDQEFVESLVGPVGRCRSDVYWLASTMQRT